MKRRTFSLIIIIVLAMVAVACNRAAGVEVTRTVGEMAEESAASEAFAGGAAPAAPIAEMPAMEAPLEADFDTATANQNQPLPDGQERLIIRTADMAIIATDTEATLAQIAALANSSGGWVVSSSVYQSTETAMTGYVVIRVPAEGFQSILDAIAGMAVEVTTLNTSGQDVTEEFVDLNARLGNLEATAARLRTFLDEARNTEEALAVNNELSRIEGEIESIRGRMQYLEQSAAFSSITVNVTPDELAQPIEVAGWQPRGVAKQAVEALANTLQAIANAVIWFVIYALPVLLIILIPFALIVWLIRRLRRREQAAAGDTAGSTRIPPPAA
jgi:hypothetical protein